MDITPEGYSWYLNNVWAEYQQQGNGVAEGLKKYLIKEIEAKLTANHKGEREGPSKLVDDKRPGIDIKIVDIFFAYENAKLIELLR